MTEPDYLSIIRERGSGALDKKMGIEITEASLTRLVGTMPVEGNTQPMGILHGGASVVLAESLGSIGTQINAGANRRIVGIDINATHHKATATGMVKGVATAVSIGKTLCCWDIVITNEDGQRTCTARITCMILADR
ncbi:PaaI HGG motif-containing thioesterase, possibly involved in aromatic compounds catabolism [Candidatus Nanopelagicaceae bacterium]